LVVWLVVLLKNYYDNLYLLIILAYQIIIWVGLIWLHVDLRREDIYWEECVGKIRSAFIRKVGSKEELDALKACHYAPIVDRLVAINFAAIDASLVERHLLLRYNAQDGLYFYLIRWLRLLSAFLIAVLFFCSSVLKKDCLWFHDHQFILLFAWLLYAIRLAKKQISICRGLEMVQRSLLLPYCD